MKSKILIMSLILSVLALASGIIVTQALSPLNARRPLFKKVQYIILHTTEANLESSLKTLREGGMIHYLINTDGVTYQILDENRVGGHVGLGMWDGRTGLDEVSVGIEVVGNYNVPITPMQEQSLRRVLDHLKEKFDIADDHVLTHSMVAYGVPNPWHDNLHRGRKRCGMQFADPELRARLGLHARPLTDPDVHARRLAIGDEYLFTMLYGDGFKLSPLKAGVIVNDAPVLKTIARDRTAWYIAGEQYDKPTTTYTLPDGTRLRGHQVKNFADLPFGTKVSVTGPLHAGDVNELHYKEIGVHGSTAAAIARAQASSESTIYVLPNGRVWKANEMVEQYPDLIKNLPRGTKVFLRYEYAGVVTRQRSAKDIAGDRWSLSSTVYVILGGRIQTGDYVDIDTVPEGSHILFSK